MDKSNKLAIGCITLLVLAFCGLVAVGAYLGKSYLASRAHPHYTQIATAVKTVVVLPTNTATPKITIPTAAPTVAITPFPTTTAAMPTILPPTATTQSNTAFSAGQVIFSDNFDDPSKSDWKRGTTASGGSISYTAGAYQISVAKPQYIIWAKHPVPTKDMVISVSAEVAQSTGDGDFGIICRGTDAKTFYAFEITEGNQYTIWKMEKGSMEIIVPPTDISDRRIFLAPNTYYRLTVICSGNKLGMAIEDTWLDVLTDDSIPDGNAVGLIAGTGDTGGFAARFDNITVTAPPSGNALPPLQTSANLPSPTPTLRSQTPAPTPQPITGKVLFKDDFSNNASGWDVYRGKDSITDYFSDGTYHIKVMEAQTDVWANPGRQFPADVIVEVKAKKVGGSDDNDFGVICRYQNADSFYAFTISSDGYYAISQMTKDGQESLSGDGMEYSDDIPQGDVTVNLRAACIGDTLSLWVNGTLIAQVHDSSITKGGDVGLIAGTFDTPNTEISFDDFVVYAPKR